MLNKPLIHLGYRSFQKPAKLLMVSQGGKDDRLGVDRSDDRDSLKAVSRESVYCDSYVYRLPDLSSVLIVK